jgi:hypothetical protein
VKYNHPKIIQKKRVVKAKLGLCHLNGLSSVSAREAKYTQPANDLIMDALRTFVLYLRVCPKAK